MYILKQKDYKKILPLVKSNHCLSVFSVLSGRKPGEVVVNDLYNPTSVLIETSECYLLAGDAQNEEFNKKYYQETIILGSCYSRY